MNEFNDCGLNNDKTNEVVNYFTECLKIKTEVNKLDNLFDENEIYNGENLLKFKVIQKFEEKYNIFRVDPIKLVEYWMMLISNNKDQSLILEVYSFLPWLLKKMETININSYIDYLDTEYIELENVFISILNNLDRMSFLYKLALDNSRGLFEPIKKISINNIKKDDIQNVINFEKDIKKYSYNSVLYKPFISKNIDISGFYEHFLYKKRNEITHRSKWAYIEDKKSADIVQNAIFNYSLKSNVEYNFCYDIKYALIYSIVVTEYINKKLNIINNNNF